MEDNGSPDKRVGRTNRPRDIAAHPCYMNDPVLLDFAQKGHRVVPLPELAEYQLVIGPNCWRHPAQLDVKDVALSVKASEFVKPDKVKGVTKKKRKKASK